MLAIVTLFVVHWISSVFFQTFFLHRYASHRMFTMSRGWERVFYLATYVTQGTSFLAPRAYAIMHREHHAYSDTPRDPHSPHVYRNVVALVRAMKRRYDDLFYRRVPPEPRFEGRYPEWPALDRFGSSMVSRFAFAMAFAVFYLAFAPSLWWLLLLPIHFVMGPIHGTIVNWCGHKYGYRNFRVDAHDRSRNSLAIDVVTMGELFQNNHHRHPSSPNFAVRGFEFDPTFAVMRVMDAVGVIDLGTRPMRSGRTAKTPAFAA